MQLQIIQEKVEDRNYKLVVTLGSDSKIWHQKFPFWWKRKRKELLDLHPTLQKVGEGLIFINIRELVYEVRKGSLFIRIGCNGIIKVHT